MSKPSDLSPALTAIRDAAKVCRHVQRDLERVRAMTKDDRSPVTIADYAAQAVVARALQSSGHQRLVAEESADFLREPQHAAHLAATVAALRDSGVWADAEPDAVLAAIETGAGEPLPPTDDRPWWTLDPIDGTKGFVRGQQYAVALACIRRGRVIFGMMACPNLPIDHDSNVDAPDPRGTMYFAADDPGDGGGGGLTEWMLGRLDGRRVPPRAPLAGRAPVLAESVESGHSDQSLSVQIMARALGGGGGGGGEFRVLRLDSQAKYAVVARGQADVYLRLPTRKGYIERIWDHAAGSIIAQQSGCTVTDIRGRELDFGRGRGLEVNLGVVAAPPELHGSLIAAIRDLGVGD
jgi:3'(2'), 5'-bisphosphate nucleotidase